MSTRHERVGNWFLTYSVDKSGRKEILGATNPEEELYISDGDLPGRQDPLRCLYDSKKFPEADSSHTENIERKKVTSRGLEILEYNIREVSSRTPMTDGGNRQSDESQVIIVNHLTGEEQTWEEFLSNRDSEEVDAEARAKSYF